MLKLECCAVSSAEMGEMMETVTEKMKVEFESYSWNVSLARVIIASFLARLDPTIEEMEDVKTAVSEAVTNCVIHGYEGKGGIIEIRCEITGQTIRISVHDDGVGIGDIAKAMEPMYTGRPDMNRSGMGFSFMEAFMDEVEVLSRVDEGTTVIMKKTIGLPREEV